jgi:NADP-dependent 3-hydroxy acid dehydrogenase YdfG
MSTAIVTGAGTGFGRATAAALVKNGIEVVGLGRDRDRLEEVRAELGDAFTPVSGDATDPVLAGNLIDTYRPRTLVLNAGASPLMRPLQQHTWQTFSRNWEVDVQQVFGWAREALLAPLEPGSVVVALSSGAALRGSPLSGGYAGSKATIRWVMSYAAEESERGGLGIRFVAVLPGLNPATDLGAAAVAGYAKRAGTDLDVYLKRFDSAASPEQVGAQIATLATDSGYDAVAYELTADGPAPAP